MARVPRYRRVRSGVAAAARVAAFEALLRIEEQRAHADDLLHAGDLDGLPAQDRDLTTALTMGVLRWQILLDAQIRRYLARPDGKLDLPVRVALRLGALQILRMDRIPDHASIHDSVALCRAAGHEHASRMVNAVLRRMASDESRGNLEQGAAVGVLDAAELAARTAHPLWMVERWVSTFGAEQARRLCEHGQRQPETTLRLADETTAQELIEAGCRLEPGWALRNSCRVVEGDWRGTEAWRSGRARAQDEGSQLVAELAVASTAIDGGRILDCCAAPGGKTMILAERNPGAQIDACEISLARSERMRSRLATMSTLPWAAKIQVHSADAAEWMKQEAAGAWGLVLVDAPCSGTGTLGRNPEIRHRLRPSDLPRQQERQVRLLKAAMRASSQRIVYATCSLEPEENEQVIADALRAHTDWRPLSLEHSIRALEKRGVITETGSQWLRMGLHADGLLRLMTRDVPGVGVVGGDGFFMIALERAA